MNTWAFVVYMTTDTSLQTAAAGFPTLPRILAAASSELIPSSACGDADTDARGVDASGGVQSCSSSETFHDLGPVCVLRVRLVRKQRVRAASSQLREMLLDVPAEFITSVSRQQGAVGSERFKAAGGGRVPGFYFRMLIRETPSPVT